MNMGINAASGYNHAFTSNDFGGSTDDQRGVNPIHCIRIAGFANGADMPIPNADIRFYNAPMINDDGVGNNGIRSTVTAQGRGGLAHPVADDFATPELALISVHSIVMFDLCP
ncbi:hypothetical protein D3C74_388950 [compost metagenome]